jgi:2'-5' RNA ligase
LTAGNVTFLGPLRDPYADEQECDGHRPPLQTGWKPGSLAMCLRTHATGGSVSGEGFRRRDADGCGRDDRAPGKVANNRGMRRGLDLEGWFEAIWKGLALMPDTETKRLFVAIWPPAHIVAGLQAAIAGLGRGLPERAVRWTRTEQIHLTLNFLGAIECGRIAGIESALRDACGGHGRHRVRVAGLGCFPDRSRPRIIWAGLAGDLRPVENLEKAIAAGLLGCGCVGEERPFHAHLTIGRVSQLDAAGRRRVAEVLAGEQSHDFGEWEVERVDLMQSMLSPQGAAYSVLESIRLV